MKTNTEFKRAALDALRGNWGKAVLATFVYYLILCALMGPTIYTSQKVSAQMQEMVSYSSGRSFSQMAALASTPEFLALQAKSSRASSLSTLLQILFLAPLGLGFMNAFLHLLVKSDNNILKNTFRLGFSDYWHKVWGMLVMWLLTMLWALLFIIPGLIKMFSYAMTPYILSENPDLTASDAIHRSRMMMRGHKFDLLWLYLSFIGWGILSILTGGIGLFWLSPYVESAKAAFYEEVKEDYALNGGLD